MHYGADHWMPLPDGGSLIAFVQPILWWDDVHAPEAPVVAVSRISVLLYLKGVVLDIIYRREDYPSVIFFHSGPCEKMQWKYLVYLEENGIYVEKLGACVKGTVLYVAADNLAAHSLAGFFESFAVDKFCRFCLAKRSDIQATEVSSGSFEPRTKENHNQHILEMADQKMTLRIILSEADIRKVTLNRRPATVEELINNIKESLELHYTFSIQYKDPEFNNELFNLSDIGDLPEKPTIQVIPVIELVPVPVSAPAESLDDSHSTADTEILSQSSQERQTQWPEQFDVPNFSVDVEYRLRQANLLYLRDGTLLKVTKDLKHEILERLAETMYGFTAYPNNAQFEKAAAALINKHPCLQEKGSTSCCSGWKNSLKYKMANYRSKRRQSGCRDVAVNAGKRGGHSSPGEPANKNIKKAKKGELNFLPNFPDGFDQTGLEDARKILVDEMQKRTPNGQLVKEKMDLTFALRRREVVETKPAICQMVERWPALFTEDQVFLEFNRIVGKNLKQEFYESIDQHSHHLIEIFRSKRGNVGQLLTQLLQQTKDSADDHVFQDLDLGILLVEREGAVSPSSLHLNPASFKIVIEGEVVMESIKDLPKAMCLLFGLTYALHLSYPKPMKNTFQFIQQLISEVILLFQMSCHCWVIFVLKS
ncbi:sterile alpha motif domain-containing 3-like isoform X1 [Labeo rohita]|uniref:Sterile alpha motif domain-containing 3-like isoform X1 n=1 Tax=Labeo rohita TaxID=84645 RepID=A0A498NG56_LABRO|nr:sterile alpha motif domain-containing 3-like isoform X1 [Labeo rohita]